MDFASMLVETVIFLLTTASMTAGRDISKEEVCRLCDGCMMGSISCQEAGRLYMLPNYLSPEIRKVIVVGQRFDSQFLSRQNLSTYSMPGMDIQELTIIGCGLRVIEPRTFSGLTSLTKLDVSKNSLSRIQGFTFSGLHLDLLRLDNNLGLTLDAFAFENLTVSSLSIQNCGLKSLSFEVFKPLFLRSGSLTTLRLTSNQLTTLDARFEPAFRGLLFLSLANNPFTCDCDLKWLIRTLQRKRRSESDDMFSDPLNHISPLMTDSDDEYPVCESPSRLRAKKIVALTANDFFCDPPQMRVLEVDFTDVRGRRIHGNSFNTSFSTAPDVVMLKCIAQGSPEMQLAWFRRSRYPHGHLARLEETRQIAPGIVEVLLTRAPRMVAVSNASEEAELLTCLGVDTYGNTSADLSLHWPPLPTTVKPNRQSGEGVDGALSGDAGTNRYPQLDPNTLDEFLFRRTFTILELIGAVVGTFTSTIFLFLMGYVLLYARHRLKFSKSSSSTAKTVYQPASNSVLMNNKFPDYQVLQSSPNHAVQGPLEAIGNRSCDPRLLQKQEWTGNTMSAAGGARDRSLCRGMEGRTSSGVYSECPTYDMPNSHLGLTALPPLPHDPPPSPPPITTASHVGTMAGGGMPIVYPPVAAQHFDRLHSQHQQLLAQTLASNPALLADVLTLQRGQMQQQQSCQEYRF